FPAQKWLGEGIRTSLLELLDSQTMRERGIYDLQAIRRALAHKEEDNAICPTRRSMSFSSRCGVSWPRDRLKMHTPLRYRPNLDFSSGFAKSGAKTQGRVWSGARESHNSWRYLGAQALRR